MPFFLGFIIILTIIATIGVILFFLALAAFVAFLIASLITAVIESLTDSSRNALLGFGAAFILIVPLLLFPLLQAQWQSGGDVQLLLFIGLTSLMTGGLLVRRVVEA